MTTEFTVNAVASFREALVDTSIDVARGFLDAFRSAALRLCAVGSMISQRGAKLAGDPLRLANGWQVAGGRLVPPGRRGGI